MQLENTKQNKLKSSEKNAKSKPTNKHVVKKKIKNNEPPGEIMTEKNDKLIPELESGAFSEIEFNYNSQKKIIIAEEAILSSFDRNSDDFSDLVSDTSSNILKRNRKDCSVKSPLWDHFTVKNDLVTCNHCVPEKKFSGKTATINLKYHLEHKHPARFQDLDAKIKNIQSITNTKPEENQPKITAFVHAKSSKERQNEFRDDIIKVLLATGSAAYMLENAEFIGFFQKYLPEYKLPYRQLYNEITFRLYDSYREVIAQMLSKNPTKLSLTFDGWNSITGNHFFGVTGIKS